jgi:glycerol-3-phosphate dehydrogenase
VRLLPGLTDLVADADERQSLDEPRMAVGAWREAARAELVRAPYDLLVVGGGIIGAGIANEAARAGLRVALVDRSDFGGATSNASSKLIHGGLRYLRLGDVKLVREAHTERRALLRVVAPHLVRRIPFLVPVYRGGPYRPAAIQAGLWTYSTLAGEKLGGLVKAERARRSVPALRVEGLRGCGVYQDAWTHDGRLCLANVTAAAEAGATVLNYAEVADLRLVGGRVRGAEVRDRLTGEPVSIEARAVVNATGPWLDSVRRLEDPRVEPYGRLSKGVHITLPLDEPWSAALTIPHDQVRVTFAYPWEGMLLLGTTDTLYEGDPAEVAATDEDVDRILAEAGVAVAASALRKERVLSSFAGLRVLPESDGATVDARRETAFLTGTGGMLTVAGGKLTTYRRIALDALGHLATDLGLAGLDRRPVPLPGATDTTNVAARLITGWSLEPSIAAHLAHFYGSRSDRVLGLAAERPELLEQIHPDAPDIAAQVVFAAREEWATGAEDVVRRRTTLAARGLAGPAVVARVEDLLAQS